MELLHPWVIILCAMLSLIIVFVRFNKKSKYTDGKKVANTKFIKETEYYKAKVRKYKIITTIIKCISVFLIVIASVLIARPVTVETKREEKFNRDIIIGLDISLSETEVNLELVRKFRQIIPSIEGDRIGIVLFNTAPIVYCPLTDDYEYIKECFKVVKEQLQIAIEHNGYPPGSYEVDGKKVPMIWYGGVGLNADEKGSSLIGDGLARNTIFISRFEKR